MADAADEIKKSRAEGGVSLMIPALILLSAVMASGAQILLKKSAQKKQESILGEYLNPYVIISYIDYFLVLSLNIFLFTKMDYRYGVISNSLAIVFVMLLSRLVLGEKITLRKWVGTMLVVAGVLCFSLIK